MARTGQAGACHHRHLPTTALPQNTPPPSPTYHPHYHLTCTTHRCLHLPTFLLFATYINLWQRDLPPHPLGGDALAGAAGLPPEQAGGLGRKKHRPPRLH